MARKTSIYYNEQGLRAIMKGQPIANLEQQYIVEMLGRVKADFFQTFGFDGKFEVRRVDTNSRRSRTTFRIVAADKRTGYILKSNPGWLAKFS